MVEDLDPFGFQITQQGIAHRAIEHRQQVIAAAAGSNAHLNAHLGKDRGVLQGNDSGALHKQAAGFAAQRTDRIGVIKASLLKGNALEAPRFGAGGEHHLAGQQLNGGSRAITHDNRGDAIAIATADFARALEMGDAIALQLQRHPLGIVLGNQLANR